MHEVTPEVLAAMGDTRDPAGARWPSAGSLDVPLDAVLADLPPARSCASSRNVRDPGNAGTVIRGADAAGADAVLVSDASVDVYTPKVVRSTAGSLFHLPVVTGVAVPTILQRLRSAGSGCSPPTARARRCCHDADLTAPHAWVMGNEAWGLEAEVRDACDEVVRVPIHGQRRVAQPRHGRHRLPLRVGGGPPHEPLTALVRGCRGYPRAMTSVDGTAAQLPRFGVGDRARRLMASSCPTGSSSSGATGGSDFANAEALRILDCDASDVLGRPVREALPLHRQVRPRLVGAHRPVGRPGHPHRPPREAARGAEGHEVLVTARYVRSGRGPAVERVMLGLRDAEARQRAERDQATVLSTVAHELRAPLTSVTGFTSSLLRRWDRFTDEQKRLMIETIEADATRSPA